MRTWLLLLVFPTLLKAQCDKTPNATPTTWYVATNGNDANAGTVLQPFRTIQKAIDTARPNDTIELRGGTYVLNNELRIRTSNLTLRSYASEWAIIQAPTHIEDISSTIWYSEPCVVGGMIENLEIIGGYYYGLKFENNLGWDEPIVHGTSNITVRNCKIHHTGRDCIKLVPYCDNIAILNCEIHHSGVGIANVSAQNAEGIDNVNGDQMLVRGCYIHDIATTGLYAKGGAKNTVIENNLIVNCGEFGVMLGVGGTDNDLFDPNNQTYYYENFDGIIRNNIVANTKHGGVGLIAAVRPQVLNNTFANVGSEALAPLYIGPNEVWVSETTTIASPCVDVKVINNIFVENEASTLPMVRIRFHQDYQASGISGTNNEIDYNRYFRNTTSPTYTYLQTSNLTFTQWRTTSGFDAHSSEGNPALTPQYHLNSNSVCINAGKSLQNVNVDYDGTNRTFPLDVGADEWGGNSLTVPPPGGVIGTGLRTIPCVSSISPTDLPSTIATNQRFETNGAITATNKVLSTGTATYDAGTYVLLKAGFEVQKGAVFTAFLDGCGNK